MTLHQKTFLRATLLFFGTIVGAGVFALPAVFQRTGVFAGSVVFWIVALIVYATHRMYAEIVLQRKTLKERKFSGHVGLVLGPWAGRFALLIHPLNLIGISFVYVLLGGEFLREFARLFGGMDSVLAWQIVFWIAGAVVVFFGLRFVARVEAWLTLGLIGTLLLAIAFFVPKALGSTVVISNWREAFFPFGIFLFSLSAYTIVPDVIEVCGGARKRAMRAVTIGSLGAAFFMWCFGIFGYAAVGPTLTSDPADVARAFPPSFFWLLPTVGILAVATSFITLMQDVRATLEIELRLSHVLSWILALSAPLALLFLTQRNFLETVSFVGSIFGAIIGMLISLMAFRVMRRARLIPILCAAAFLLAFIWRILTL